MDLKHIRSFAAVAREGNLTRAAEHLHLTQPALSLQLKNFQESLDLTLFSRSAQGLSPNADGRALLPPALRVLDALDDFQRAIATLRDTLQGELRLGTILDPEFLRLGAALRHLMARYPAAAHAAPRHVRLGGAAGARGRAGRGILPRPAGRAARPAGAARAAAGRFLLLRGRAQGLGSDGQRPGLEGDRRPALDLDAAGLGPPSPLARKFAELDAVPNAVAEVDQEASMLDLVRSGVGLSLARDSLALRESQTHGLLLVQGLEIRTELSFVCLASRSGNRWWRPPSTRCARPSPDMAAARLHAADNARAIRTADMTPRK